MDLWHGKKFLYESSLVWVLIPGPMGHSIIQILTASMVSFKLGMGRSLLMIFVVPRCWCHSRHIYIRYLQSNTGDRSVWHHQLSKPYCVVTPIVYANSLLVMYASPKPRGTIVLIKLLGWTWDLTSWSRVQEHPMKLRCHVDEVCLRAWNNSLALKISLCNLGCREHAWNRK